jgi:hypothetical protein
MHLDRSCRRVVVCRPGERRGDARVTSLPYMCMPVRRTVTKGMHAGELNLGHEQGCNTDAGESHFVPNNAG